MANLTTSNEVWKDIFGYEGLYQISNLGRVKSFSRTMKGRNGCIRVSKERVLKPWSDKLGYPRIELVRYGVKSKFLIHRLVAIMFVPNPNNLPVIDHIDNNPGNPAASNLTWCTQLYNVRKSIKQGRFKCHLHQHKAAKSRLKNIEDVRTGVIYLGIKEAAQQLGLNQTSIGKSLRGEKKTYPFLKYV